MPDLRGVGSWLTVSVGHAALRMDGHTFVDLDTTRIPRPWHETDAAVSREGYGRAWCWRERLLNCSIDGC